MKLTFTDDGDSFPEPVSWPKGYSADHFDDDLQLTPNKPQSKEPLENDTQPKPAEMPKGKDPQHFDPDMPPLVNTGREVPVVTHLQKGDDFIEAEAAVGIGGGGGTPPTSNTPTPPSTLGRRAHEEAFGTADAPRTPPLTASRRRRQPSGTPPNNQPKTPSGQASRSDSGVEEQKINDPERERREMEKEDYDPIREDRKIREYQERVKMEKEDRNYVPNEFKSGKSETRRPKKIIREDPDLASSYTEVKRHEKERDEQQTTALETLGLKAGSTKAQITKAYRRLSAQNHPDKGGDEATMKKINDAYERLIGKEINKTQAQWIVKNYDLLYKQYYRGDPEFKLTAPMAKALRANTGLKTLKQGMSVVDALKIMYDEFAYAVQRHVGSEQHLRQLDSRATASVKDRTAGRLATKKMRLPEEEV